MYFFFFPVINNTLKEAKKILWDLQHFKRKRIPSEDDYVSESESDSESGKSGPESEDERNDMNLNDFQDKERCKLGNTNLQPYKYKENDEEVSNYLLSIIINLKRQVTN